MRTPRGFTLVELLVVIAIITVLLSLLTPALDQAVYQAELAACGGTLRSISGGVLVYSQSYRGRYPWRSLADAQGTKPVHVFNGENKGNPADTHDDRRVMRQCFSIKQALLDPLCQKVDYDNTLASSAVEVSYPLWFGFRYKASAHAGQGMYKLGDRMTFTDDAGITRRFNLLASDMDVISLDDNADGKNFTHSSHPDKTGTRFPTAVQDQNAISPVLPGAGLTITTSRWDGNDCRRGPLDMNYAYDDGSVLRLTDVVLGPKPGDRVTDSRGQEMVAVDEYSDDSFGKGSDYYLPDVR
jgi:prepilin-type N-terminal cleavage/methylation domain-containing protein